MKVKLSCSHVYKISIFQRQRTVAPPGAQDVDQVKRAFAKQRAKDLTEFAKNNMVKDRDIEHLRQKCQQLTERLASTQNSSHVDVTI